MSRSIENAQQDMLELSRVFRENDVAWGSTGNISAKVDNERFLISASGSWVSEISAAEMTCCQMNGQGYDGLKPSVEWLMHQGVYLARPEVNYVAHLSPYYSTLIACTDLMPDQVCTVENMVYLGRVGRVPFMYPGSEKLAHAVTEASHQYDSVILSNHGILCMHATLKGLMMRVMSFEMSCRLVYSAACSGMKLNEVSEDKIQELRRIAKV